MTESDSVRRAGRPSKVYAFGLFALAAAFAASPLISARQRPLPSSPTFRSGVNLVTIDVVVRDKRTGRLVTGLTKKDFEIEDEGKRQDIATFAAVDLPEVSLPAITPGAHQPTASALDHVATNQHPEGRLIAFFINDASLPPEATAYLRDWLHRYVEHHMAANDLVTLRTVTDLVPSQEFTSNRTRLLAMTDRITGSRGDLPWGVSPDYILGELRQLIESLAQVPPGRRKAVICFACPGAPSNLQDPLYAEVANAGAAASVAIYPVSVTGVGGLMNVVSDNPGVARAATMRPLDIGLGFLAKRTGGEVFDRNDFDNVLQEIEDQAGTYYLLGFTPSTIDRKPGDFRRLKVTVRRPDLSVQARNGYIQNAPINGFELNETTPSIKDVASGPVPETAMPLRMQVSCFRGNAKGDTVLVTVRSSAPAARLTGHTLEYAMLGLDDHARIEDETDGTSAIPDISAGLLPGISAISVLHLKPGLATIKAALRTSAGLTGSVFVDVNVPTLDGSLALSDVALAAVPDHLLVLGEPPAFLRQHLPAPPTTRRAFSADEVLAIYGEVYARSDHQAIVASADIRRDDGTRVRRIVLPLQRAADNGRALSYSTRIPLRGLAAGDYRMELTASAGGGAAVHRAIVFTINPNRER